MNDSEIPHSRKKQKNLLKINPMYLLLRKMKQRLRKQIRKIPQKLNRRLLKKKIRLLPLFLFQTMFLTSTR